jgi:N-formylglutamate deformylase
MQVVELKKGSVPLLVSIPHCGTGLPEDILSSMTPAALELADTDWHVDRLYDFALSLGASVLKPAYSRYLIDLNRPADNSNLYPGANSTGLCPTSDFAERPLYHPGAEPGEAEIDRRLHNFWQPYHDQLQAELKRLRETHGIALLFEAHSIRSVVPRLFEGKLPDLNVGSADGCSCSRSLLDRIESLLESQIAYSYVVDGRFKGGYITRAYGAPDAGVHAVQMELSQSLYMQEQLPFEYLPAKAETLQPLLIGLLQRMIDWAEEEVG